MNKLVRLSLMSAVVNNIYSGCGNCCCCNKKSNNNNWSGTSGNDKPNDKPEEKPKPDGKLNPPVDENTKTPEEWKKPEVEHKPEEKKEEKKDDKKPILTIEVDSKSVAITINSATINKLDGATINSKEIFDKKVNDDDLKRINCHPLTEEQYKTVNDSNVDLTNLHKEDDKFITYSIKKGDEYFLVDINIDGDNKAIVLKNKGISELNIVRSKNIKNGSMLLSTNLTIMNGLSNLDTTTFTSMENMFFDVKAEKLDLSRFETKNVTDMGLMFNFCSELKEINGINRFNTENVTDMYGMFRYCESLTELDLSSFNTEEVTDIREMFKGCEKLQKLILGKKFIVRGNCEKVGTNEKGDSILYTYSDMFSSCNSLECVIKDEPDANLKNALNTTSPHKDFEFKDANKDDVAESGYYRTDCVDNYKKSK